MLATRMGETMAKLRVGLLFGGRSSEHEISLVSATSILGALDPSRYDVTLVAVDHDGHWRLGDPALPPNSSALEAAVQGDEVDVPVAPGQHTLIPVGEGGLKSGQTLDVIFPVIHGRGGEDGSLQGLLELAGIPYVGSGVLGSAVQMDKDVAKRLLGAAGLPITPGVCVRSQQLGDGEALADAVIEELGSSLFVKPANQGSSVGISKVERREELLPALRDAARYDTKILVERAIDAREIEVALLGNDPIEASIPGEIRTRNTFYDYDAKYVDDATELFIPAPVDDSVANEMRRLAVEAAVALESAGLARVDFLLERDTDQIFINEVNSIPGFTQGSMYPLLWQATGIPYPALLDRLIELALERHRINAALETRYEPTR
jgi:D-alanine-D-alanine ligase